MRLKDDYTTANCCKPTPPDAITGYYSHDNIIRVHRFDCPNLAKAQPGRLVSLEWSEILAEEVRRPGDDIALLDDIDILILNHHRDYGFDYSNKVAAMLTLERKVVFDRHQKLRDMGLLQRVAPRMIQYRRNIVKGKWIKHRNHTYYDITDKGRLYLHSCPGGDTSA